jgi:hypothetical protein
VKERRERRRAWVARAELLALKALFALAFGLSLLAARAGVAWAREHGPLRDPEEALQDFLHGKEPAPRGESELMDPLILAGDRVVPLVLRELSKRDMPRALYAIGFLGRGRYREALPVLERILSDPGEHDSLRAYALLAIHRIDGPRGRELAPAYFEETERTDVLWQIERAVAEDRSFHDRHRTYWAALLGIHDC